MALFHAELLTQAGFVFRAEFVLAGGTGFLVQVATRLIGGLAAVYRRHFLLHALAEGRASLALAFLVGHLARFALLRVACLGAIEILHLFAHALLALRAGRVLAGFHGLGACFAVGVAGDRVHCQLAVTRGTGARAAALHHPGAAAGAHAVHAATHSSRALSGLGAGWQADQGSQQGTGDHHQAGFHFSLLASGVQLHSRSMSAFVPGKL